MTAQRMAVIVLVAGLLIAAAGATAQGGPAWVVTEAAPLALPSSVGLRTFPAPDGRHYAYESAVRLNGHIDRFLCAADSLSATEALCLVPLENVERGLDVEARTAFMPVSWAADGSRLAFVGQPLLTGEDVDLWIMDVAAGTWTNLADDGYDGPLTAAEAPPGVTLELQPAWSPDGAFVAVERTVIGAGGAFQPSTISLVETTTGAVTDLTTLPGSSQYPFDAGATAGLTWSPDGAQLALNVAHSPLDAAVDGVWLVDLESGALTQVAALADIQASLSAVYPEVTLASLGPLSWSPDGARLLFWAGNINANPVAIWAFWITLADGSITPLPLPAHPNDSGTRRGIWPLQAAWSPDGGSVLVAASGKLPDETLESLDPAARARMSVRLVDVASGQSFLLGGLPAGTAAPFYLATWGPDGDALLNGYHLRLAQP